MVIRSHILFALAALTFHAAGGLSQETEENAALAAQPAGRRPQEAEGNSAQNELRARFESSGLRVGAAYPEVDIHDDSGKRINTRSFKGKYTVIVNGCLT